MRKNRIMRGGARGVNFQGASDATDPLERHIEIGVVRSEDGDSHFSVEDGAVWVDVVIMPEEAPVTCRLTAVAGGPGNGVWKVPNDGTEVVVAFPGGSMENGGLILAVLDSARVPGAVDDASIVIVAPKVYVYSEDKGNAVPLATKADVEAVGDKVDDHVHVYVPPSTSTPLFTTSPMESTAENPLSTPASPVPSITPDPVGTQVLESE